MDFSPYVSIGLFEVPAEVQSCAPVSISWNASLFNTTLGAPGLTNTTVSSSVTICVVSSEYLKQNDGCFDNTTNAIAYSDNNGADGRFSQRKLFRYDT
jgi:hypothetical protein